MIKKVAETHALKKAFGIAGLQSEHDWEFAEVARPIDTDGQPSADTQNYIYELIRTSKYDDEQKEYFYSQVGNLSNAKAEEMIENLRLNQLEDYEMENVSQKAIQHKLDLIDKDERK